MEKKAKFNIGDIVTHNKKGYQAIIIDIDPLFQASGRYNPAAMRRGFDKKKPWYRLLIDESEQMTYVEESSLIIAPLNTQINNPQIGQYLLQKGQQFITTQTYN